MAEMVARALYGGLSSDMSSYAMSIIIRGDTDAPTVVGSLPTAAGMAPWVTAEVPYQTLIDYGAGGVSGQPMMIDPAAGTHSGNQLYDVLVTNNSGNSATLSCSMVLALIEKPS